MLLSGQLGTDARIAQPQPTPDEKPEINPKQRIAEQRHSGAHIDCDRPAEVAGEGIAAKIDVRRQA